MYFGKKKNYKKSFIRYPNINSISPVSDVDPLCQGQEVERAERQNQMDHILRGEAVQRLCFSVTDEEDVEFHHGVECPRDGQDPHPSVQSSRDRSDELGEEKECWNHQAGANPSQHCLHD